MTNQLANGTLPSNQEQRFLSGLSFNPVIVGLATTICLFVGFGVWSGTAPLASAIIVPGVVVVAGNVKTVQSLDGGTLESLLVHDGDVVTPGQELVTFESNSQRSVLRSLQLSLFTNKVEQARLRAEAAYKDIVDSVPIPEALKGTNVSEIFIDEHDLFESQTAKQRVHLLELKSERDGYEAAVRGIDLEAVQLRRRLAFANEDIRTSTKMVRLGIESLKSARDFEVAAAVLVGELGSLAAKRLELLQEVTRSELESKHAVWSYREASESELQRLTSDAQDIGERITQSSISISRQIVKSPVAGTVINESIHTIGGVVAAGAPILEIVPSGQPLIVESQVRPIDVEEVSVGSTVDVRAEGDNPKTSRATRGQVVSVSADRLYDQTRNEAYFLVRVQIDCAKIHAATGLVVRPGMSLELMILRHSKTLVEYLLSPLMTAFGHSLRE